MKAAKFKIQVEGLAELRKKLNADYLLADIWRDALEKATRLVEQQAKKRAPRNTGRLQASITHRLSGRPTGAMSAKPVSMAGIVSVGARSSKGFPYGYPLEAGHRTPPKQRGFSRKGWRAAVKAAGTRIPLSYRGSGKSTAGWLRGSLAEVRGRVDGILAEAARKIEQRWNR